MKKVLISGGHGDIAKAIFNKLKLDGNYEIKTPGKEEFDVTSFNSIEDYIKNFVPDILINNAGYVVPQSVRNGDLKHFKKELDINLGGVFYCTAVALKYNPNLQVINIGSSAATKIHGTWSGYCATKAGVVMATQCWAEDGINAVCISPGRTATKMRRGLYPNEDQSSLMRPDDFAEIVVKAVRGEYKPGSHINVNKQNVEALING